MGINNVRGTSPCSVNEEPRILSGLLKFWSTSRFYISPQNAAIAKKKEEEKLKYASTGLQVSYQFVSIFPFCCLATLQGLRIQIGGHHESFCVFWNLFFTQNKLSVYTEIKVWNISNWKILNTEMELVAKHVFLVSVNISLSSIFLRCYQHDIFFSVIYFWWL